MSYNPLRKLCLKFEAILTTGGKFGTNGLSNLSQVEPLFNFFITLVKYVEKDYPKLVFWLYIFGKK